MDQASTVQINLFLAFDPVLDEMANDGWYNDSLAWLNAHAVQPNDQNMSDSSSPSLEQAAPLEVSPLPTNTRLATPADLLRLGLIDYAANAASEVFEYPASPESQAQQIHSLARTFAVAIRDEHALVLVVEADFDSHERDKDQVRLPQNHPALKDSPPLTSSNRGAVGFAIFIIGADRLQGETWAFKGTETTIWPNLGEYAAPIEYIKDNLRAFPGDLKLHRLMVHPAYQKQGHGKMFMKFGFELAYKYAVERIELYALRSAADFYRRLGFEEGEDFEMDENEGPMFYPISSAVSAYHPADKDAMDEAPG